VNLGPEIQAHAASAERNTGETLTDIARSYNVSRSTILRFRA
jgi:hypothetical protein